VNDVNDEVLRGLEYLLEEAKDNLMESRWIVLRAIPCLEPDDSNPSRKGDQLNDEVLKGYRRAL
jgi:hypothetical protein